MAKNKKRTLDLNTAQRPTLELTLMDDDQTLVRVSTPTEGLIQEMQQISPTMLDVMETGDQAGIEEIYNLAARLINCNRDFFKTTGEELRTKYRMDVESAILFFNVYMDFINDIVNQKN